MPLAHNGVRYGCFKTLADPMLETKPAVNVAVWRTEVTKTRGRLKILRL